MAQRPEKCNSKHFLFQEKLEVIMSLCDIITPLPQSLFPMVMPLVAPTNGLALGL